MSAEQHQAPTGDGTVALFTTTPRRLSEQRTAPVPAHPTGGDEGTFTCVELQEQADRATAALAELGVRAGDRVAVMLPMAAESVVVTLACVRLDALRITLPLDGEPLWDLRPRLARTGATVVVTVDACLRDGVVLPLKSRLDRALAGTTEVRHVLVARHLPRPVPWTPGRDLWWHEALAAVG